MVERKSENSDPRRPSWSDIRPPSRPLNVPARRLGDISQPPTPVLTPAPAKPATPPAQPLKPAPVAQPVPTPTAHVSQRPRFESQAPKKPSAKKPVHTVVKKQQEKLKASVTSLAAKRPTSLSKRRFPKRIVVIAAIIVIIGLALAAWFIFKPAKKPVVADAGSPTTSTASDAKPTLTKGTPTYATLLPAGKTASSLGGWTRVSPANANAVYAYTDTIDTVAISVSEQPLPADFKADPDAQVKQLASNYNATQKLTAGSTTAWLGTSRSGPQVVIFYKQNTLFLAKSLDRINTNSWTGYISSLE